MVSVPSPPGGRETSFARVLLLPAVLMAAATGAAAALVAEPARIPVAVTGAAATLVVIAVAAEAVRRGRAAAALRLQHAREIAQLEQRLAAHDDDILHLAQELMPACVRRLQAHNQTRSEVMRAMIDGSEVYRGLPHPQRVLLRNVLRIVDREEAMRDSAQRAFVNVARRVQTIVHKQSADLRDMEEDHGRTPEVFDDLLRIDHGTALIGRLADSIAVLGGARPSRKWPKPVPLFSVLRGAMSRIMDFPRIDLHSVAKVNVDGISVEPLIHACAELFDNATRYSPPHTRVHVTAHEVQTGVAIEIEDAGISLNDVVRERVERKLEEAKAGIDVDDLGETPRLGLAVVGRLARMYDMQIALRQSAYGGVRAVLIVPRDMLTDEPAPAVAHGIGAAAVQRIDDDGNLIADERPYRRRRPTSGPPLHSSRSMSPPPEDDVPVVTEWTPEGLPQRRSRVRGGFPHTVPAPAPAADDWRQAAPTPQKKKEEPQPGIWLEAFTKAANGVDVDSGTAAGESGQPSHGHQDNEGDRT
ncbi:sensor histidine kinase [Streptomyces albidoflavus]